MTQSESADRAELTLTALQARYAEQQWAIDHGDAPGWAQTFGPDGVFSSVTYPEPVRGRSELTVFAESFAARAIAAGETHRHLVVNLHVVDGDSHTLRCRLTFLVLAHDPGGRQPRMLRMVDAEDLWQRNPLLLLRRRVGFPPVDDA